MWKFNETDELYHSLKSRYYMAVDNSEYLQHFKYIKREKKNGRWVYYYDRDLDKQRDILKSNIHMEENMIKNNKTYTNPQTGQKFGPDHYKKAVKYLNKIYMESLNSIYQPSKDKPHAEQYRPQAQPS